MEMDMMNAVGNIGAEKMIPIRMFIDMDEEDDNNK